MAITPSKKFIGVLFEITVGQGLSSFECGLTVSVYYAICVGKADILISRKAWMYPVSTFSCLLCERNSNIG